MPKIVLDLLKFLVLAEPLLTAAALLALFRMRGSHALAAMRSYLWARLILSSWQNFLILGERFMPAYPVFWNSAYFYSWLAGLLVILALLYRTAAAGLSFLLRDLPGLLDMARLLFRWLVVAGLLLLIPSGTQLVRNLLDHQPLTWQILSFLRASSLAALLPLCFVLTVASRRRLSPRTRLFGIMAGFCLEPSYNLIRSWFVEHAFWGWGNLWNQIVTDAMLVLWLVYFLKEEPPVRTADASPQMLHWDRIAHSTLRFRRSAGWIEGTAAGEAGRGADRRRVWRLLHSAGEGSGNKG